MFTRTRKQKTTLHWSTDQRQTSAATIGSKITLASGVTVDASCNATVTITCLKELYNAVGYTPSAKNGNKIAVTGYLEQFANIADLQKFYANQTRDALGSSFDFVSVNGKYYGTALLAKFLSTLLQGVRTHRTCRWLEMKPTSTLSLLSV